MRELIEGSRAVARVVAACRPDAVCTLPPPREVIVRRFRWLK
ncbi:hypothetical protein [Glycomyces albidus]|jgi:hypothetical protein|nr:hypothetical protein [Glycomyces albidus]